MPYEVHVVDQVDRKAQIDAQKKAKDVLKEDFTYKDKREQLPVVRLPIDLPIYSMANFRTRVEQQKYVHENKKNKNFFIKGEENQTAQAAQHKILLKMSKDTRGNIYREFEHVKRQTEPLLLTAYGVVVNGNRRLAAMRELYTEERESYASFSHVDAMILPESATLVEIDLIESRLQMVPETKLEYEWIPRRLKLRYERDELKIPLAQLKEVYRFRREADINTEVAQLDLVDEYLAFIDAPGEYELVDQGEQIFKELQSAVKGKPPNIAQRSRQVAFMLIKHPQVLNGRVYNYRNAFGKDLDKVLEQFAIENGIDLLEEVSPGEAKASSNEDEDDPLADLGEKVIDRYEPLKDVLQDNSKTKDIAQHIARIYDSIEQGQREEDVKRAALKSAQNANRLLHNIDLSESDPATFPSIATQLKAIIVIAKKLRNEIEQVKAKLPKKGRGRK